MKILAAYCLKYERTEYGKIIRKQYEQKKIKEKKKEYETFDNKT